MLFNTFHVYNAEYETCKHFIRWQLCFCEEQLCSFQNLIIYKNKAKYIAFHIFDLSLHLKLKRSLYIAKL